MNTFIAWLSVFLGGWLWFKGYGEPSWPIGFLQGGETFLYGVGPALLLYHAMKLVGKAGVPPFQPTNNSFLLFTVIGLLGAAVFGASLMMIAIGVINGEIVRHPELITIAVLLLPLVIIGVPLFIKEEW
ncbi:MAG: hypothetical protein A2942_04975 [Candidatus Lloydbacteria bacterium RIFCSPLOWO2_01_FULL_50_20]|uniref:Uncharacterized protein n=1 Tax=Candidatus Lloydbacteria bacterium RIFCSPLOWO2_01_FULL_50_20 TaxID=1798665 RepID=A0A1G2DH69_9BACT|nr:MAG: hypothetical protein A3C13_00480 [Candidatus Lloydbacteria bacterium RIFCSPHIGHO2_02_FULL_50_11]OGZ12916.1 MAG: hypothetical protein A2942_04975 [Candidatus Lloydbacteria bacterium RIFCSPLOWO2_01_FULL_50_20]